MTDKELIKVLRWCAVDHKYGCVGCPGEELCDEGKHENKAMSAAADRMEALLAENEHLREVTKMIPQWVIVSERLPENDERVLALCKDGVIHDMRWNYPRWEWRDRLSGDAYFEGFATHWMPLPSTEGVE